MRLAPILTPRLRRALVVASFLGVYEVAGISYADIAPGPPRRRPEQSTPSPSTPPRGESGKTACGTGAAMALLGIAAFGAWRFSKVEPREAVVRPNG